MPHMGAETVRNGTVQGLLLGIVSNTCASAPDKLRINVRINEILLMKR